MGIELYQGDSLEVMKHLEDDSVHSIVTDPPYGISFMGKKWDYDVPSVEIWQEALRVLKPGGTALIFAGSRTQHRMAVNVEDAGFILKDTIMWIYGSGFPKSTDISKQIDRYGGAGHLINEISEQLKKARLKRGILLKNADQMFCGGSTNYSWFEGRPQGNRIPNQETFQKIMGEWPELKSLQLLVAEAEREVTGSDKSGKNAMLGCLQGVENGGEFDITKPATPAAQLWEGYGTNLKPAYEPVIIAMKPNDGTYANNALKHGVAGLNIDGCRVETNEKLSAGTGVLWSHIRDSKKDKAKPIENIEKGRFPANIIHDGSEEVLSLFPKNAGAAAPVKGTERSNPIKNAYGEYDRIEGKFHDDSGSAARFFYCAKASKSERGEGNNHPTVKPLSLIKYLCKLVHPPNDEAIILDNFMGSNTTGLACELMGYNYIGIERDIENFDICKNRIRNYNPENYEIEPYEPEENQLSF